MKEMTAIATVLAAAMVIIAFTGMWPTVDNPYRSYTLQACAWLEGRLDLGQDYPWLELAVFEGKYYVSFPPFPSLVLLPFAAAFGADTPDHWIALGVTLLGAALAVRLCRAMGREEESVLLTLYLYLCNGYMFIAVQGWVWFLAQALCFTCSLMALLQAAKGRGGASVFFLACAVGCRPMAALYLPLLLLLSRRAERMSEGVRKKRFGQALWGVGAAALLLLYLALNAVRFRNPFEFGHNYLPEFTRSEQGQFSLAYVAENLGELLRLPQPGGENGALIFPTYDCMAFWLISPMTVTAALAWGIGACASRGKDAAERVLFPLLITAHLMIILCHKTLGGWQFGNRYLLDMMPWLFYCVLLWGPKTERFILACAPSAVMGLAVNLVGTVAAYNHWI